jgi:magnesium chelatase subunit I
MIASAMETHKRTDGRPVAGPPRASRPTRRNVQNVTRPDIRTVGELRTSGHVQKTVRAEIRDNLLTALRQGTDPWPGLHGFST